MGKSAKSGDNGTKTLEDSTTSSSKKKKINGNKKGKAFERHIANELGHIFPDAQRELEFQASNNRGTDIENTDLFQFQCKRYAGYAPIGKIKEIQLESPNHIPVLVTQGNRMECMAVLPFSKLVTLIEIAYGLTPRLKHPFLNTLDGLHSDMLEIGKKLFIQPTVPADKLVEYQKRDTGMTIGGKIIYEIPEGVIPLDLSEII